VISHGGNDRAIQVKSPIPATELDARALQPQDQSPHALRSRRCATRNLSRMRRTRIRSRNNLRSAIATPRELVNNNPRALPVQDDQVRVKVDTASDILGRQDAKTGADGLREKDGKKLKFDHQTSSTSRRQDTQADSSSRRHRRPARHRDQIGDGSVFFSSDRRQSPDTIRSSTATCRCTRPP